MHNRKLGRTADHRKALLRNLATEVVLRGKINGQNGKYAQNTLFCCS